MASATDPAGLDAAHLPPPSLDHEAVERQTRHLAYARQIQESASRMLHAATNRAVRQMEQPDPPPDPLPTLDLDRPHAHVPPSRPPARPRERDYTLAANRFSLMLERGIALENDILAARPAYRALQAPRPAPPPPDPRRALIREPLLKAVQAENAPGQAARMLHIDAQIDAKLAADPERRIDPLTILGAIVDLLAIDIDLAHLSDEILGRTPQTDPVPETAHTVSPPSAPASAPPGAHPEPPRNATSPDAARAHPSA